MPQVKVFHARVGVRGRDGLVKVICANLPDFSTPGEILGDLGRFFGASTAGEVVAALCDRVRSQRLPVDFGGLSVSDGVGFRGEVVDWSERV